MKNYFVELTEKGKSHLAVEEISDEDLKLNELLIKTEVSMISAGTELSRAFAIKQGFKYPVRPGYSCVAKVIGKHKDNNEYEIGDRIFCGATHALYSRIVPQNKTQGMKVYKLPKDIDAKEATIISLGQVALSGVNLTRARVGDVAAVFGLGNIGIITCLLYQHLGLKVIGVDPVENRCKLAEELGVKITCSSDAVGKINEITNGKGADICADVTGVSEAIIDAINACKKYGQVTLIGSPRASYTCDVMPIFSRIHMKNLTVIGAFNETAPASAVEGSDNSVARNMDIIVEMIKNKEIDVNKMISYVADPKDCEKAYYDLMYNKDKCTCVIFDWKNYQ